MKSLANKIADLIYENEGWKHRYSDAYDLANLKILELPELKGAVAESADYAALIDRMETLSSKLSKRYEKWDFVLLNDLTDSSYIEAEEKTESGFLEQFSVASACQFSIDAKGNIPEQIQEDIHSLIELLGLFLQNKDEFIEKLLKEVSNNLS